jgi:DNA-binding transcriptional LysR family regulator
MDIEIYRCFIAVVETGSFTKAGERLGVGQSAVSQQIRRLEQRCGRQLLLRDPQAVRLTPEGEALLPHALAVQRAVADAETHLREPPLTGTVRIGIAEDFAGTRLPELLGWFRRAHTAVRLQVETGLSGSLSDRLDRGDFDLVVSKRADAKQGGLVIFREPLVWAVAAHHAAMAQQRPLPLALHPRPSVTAEAVMTALRSAGIPCLIVLTSPSITGLRAGVMAGLGISAFGRRFMPPGLDALASGQAGLPDLPVLEFGLERRAGTLSPAVEALATALESGDLADED